MYLISSKRYTILIHSVFMTFIFFLQGRFYLKNRQKPTATLIYTDNIIYNIYTTYIPPPPIINTFSDVKIHVSKVHVHQNSKRWKQFNLCLLANDDQCKIVG